MSGVVATWKDSLRHLLQYYEKKRGWLVAFYPKLFLFFVVVNMLCYWLAMFTAFPELMHGAAGAHYLKVSLPVGVLGALFDSLSFFVTVYIIRRALVSRSGGEYVAHLSVDLIIAVLATFWVVFVFSISGWLINIVEARHQVFADRQERYAGMLADAVARPTDNLRNIYFGVVMGISAGLPTFLHVSLFFRSASRTLVARRLRGR